MFNIEYKARSAVSFKANQIRMKRGSFNVSLPTEERTWYVHFYHISLYTVDFTGLRTTTDW